MTSRGLLLAVVLAAACGSAPVGAPASGRRIAVVTDSDSGRTIRLRAGDRLQVRLNQDSYDPPTSSSAALERRSSTGGYPSADPVEALFEARSPGSADVSSSSDYACFHTSPRCLRPTRLWTVHVVVD